MFKNYLRYCLPVTLILLALLLGPLAASVLQNWQNPSGTNVANIDSTGSLNITGTGAVNFNGVISTSTSASTAAITSSGSVTLAQPFAGSAYKKVVYDVLGVTTTANTAYTYPVAFTQTPVTVNATASSGSLGVLFTSGLTGGTLGSLTTTTGIIIIEGN
jgi:hypothetical protein